jgi:hypothetical protein
MRTSGLLALAIAVVLMLGTTLLTAADGWPACC